MKGEDSRLELRRQALVNVARAQFGRNGYESTSLADVVREAGGSLATVYKLFGNKEGLLLAVLSDFDIEPLLIDEFDEDCPPAQQLERIGLAINALMTQPDSMIISRLSMNLGLSNPAWARRYDLTMRSMVVEPLIGLFQRWSDRLLIKSDEAAEQIAESFIGLFSYPFMMAALKAREPYDIGEDELRLRIRSFARGQGLIDS